MQWTCVLIIANIIYTSADNVKFVCATSVIKLVISGYLPWIIRYLLYMYIVIS